MCETYIIIQGAGHEKMSKHSDRNRSDHHRDHLLGSGGVSNHSDAKGRDGR